MRGRRSEDTREDPTWIRIQGRTNARLLLLSRELKAEFVAPKNWNAFAVVRGELSGCQFELRVERETSDMARTGAIHHVLELDLHQGAAQACRVLAGDGLLPPGLDPARLRSAVEANCYSFMSRTQT